MVAGVKLVELMERKGPEVVVEEVVLAQGLLGRMDQMRLVGEVVVLARLPGGGRGWPWRRCREEGLHWSTTSF
jgi:hypothetical protein